MPGKKTKYVIPAITLTDACALGDMTLVKKVCRDEAVGPHWVDGSGMGGLHAACAAGKEEVVGYLIREHQADVNLKTRDGHTPLMCAARNGKLGLVDMLVEAGVDPTAYNAELLTAEDYARQMGHNDVLAYLHTLPLKSKTPAEACKAGDLHALKVQHFREGWVPDENDALTVLAGFVPDAEDAEARTNATRFLPSFKFLAQLDKSLLNAGGGHPKPTPLVNAIEHNNWGLFNFLVDAGADLTLDSVMQNSTNAQAPEQVAKLLHRTDMVSVLAYKMAVQQYDALMEQKRGVEVHQRAEWVANLQSAKKEREACQADYDKVVAARETA